MLDNRERRKWHNLKADHGTLYILCIISSRNIILGLWRGGKRKSFQSMRLSQCRSLHGQSCRLRQRITLPVNMLASCHEELTLSWILTWNLEAKYLFVNWLWMTLIGLRFGHSSSQPCLNLIWVLTTTEKVQILHHKVPFHGLRFKLIGVIKASFKFIIRSKFTEIEDLACQRHNNSPMQSLNWLQVRLCVFRRPRVDDQREIIEMLWVNFSR